MTDVPSTNDLSSRFSRVHRWYARFVMLLLAMHCWEFMAMRAKGPGNSDRAKLISVLQKRQEQGRGLVDIDLNGASKMELMLLPRIGPVLAERIIAYRSTHGDFSTLASLHSVQGIGPKTIDGLRSLAVTALPRGHCIRRRQIP